MTDVMDKRRSTDELVRSVEEFNTCLKGCCDNDLEIKTSLGPKGLQVYVYDKHAIYHEEEIVHD